MNKVYTIDLHFLGNPKAIACYLIPSSEGPVLFETGPYSHTPQLKEGIRECGFRPEDIKHVFLTHIHLDHAGGAWHWAGQGARVYVHPFGEKHLQNPEKLMASAARIYKDKMDLLWGEMRGIPADQLQVVGHGEQITVGDQAFTAWHTPGHARHHIAWQYGTNLIAGDVAGVKIGKGPVVPPCPPPDIDLEAWEESIQLLRSLPLLSIYLSHYGEVTNIGEHLKNLLDTLQNWALWIKPYAENGNEPEEITLKFKEMVHNQFVRSGCSEKVIKAYEAANPTWMSVWGLMRYWQKQGL